MVRDLFEHDIEVIHAVVFVVKATDARLTAS